MARVMEVKLNQLEPTRKHRQAALIITKVIDRYHYKKTPLDNKLSEQILKRYLDTLDPNHFFFLKRDIDAFSRYRHKLDDYLRSARLEPAFEIFRIYRKRVSDRVAKALKLLDAHLDFNVDEEYEFDRENAPWPATRKELDDIWRKRVKNDILNLRLAGKDNKEIRKTLRERYEGLNRRVHQFDADDVFQSFINAYTLALEPHTSYMSPSTSENFDISMRLSLEGIGAVLRQDGEYTVVQEVVSGGPAKISGQLHAGDRIVGVAQGLTGPMEDVVGWRLQDVVEKIRGPKGSVVRLQVLPEDAGANGKGQMVTLVRNKIKLENQAAKASVIEGLKGLGGLRIGVIDIPTFYRDFRAESRGDKDFRSTTRDVRKLLKDLKAKHVDGIIIDLRENGGGSLSEATELTGLFIDTGPVVQVKDAFGEVEVERDIDPGVVYDGPLAVLVDRNSASASEIFAGAIQDYQRGIIIGEPTFGKGTVQTLIDLDRFVAGDDSDLGRLRLTMAQFFRVNGSSTQHKGVVPDITFPTAATAGKHGERALENALPWARIKAAHYVPGHLGAVAQVRRQAMARIQHDSGFQLLEEEQHMLDDLDKQKKVTLLESKREQEWKKKEALRQEYKNRFRASVGLPPVKDDKDDKKEAPAKDREKEAKATDRILLNEAARILADYVKLRREEESPRAAMR